MEEPKMEESEIKLLLDGIVEELASIEHERWAHWQQYVHGKGIRQPEGSLLLPAELVSRWEAQIATPYADLSEEEKQSDREQVHRYLPRILAEISKRCAG
jgi:hypothetical protein